jgi:hypothetical protein
MFKTPEDRLSEIELYELVAEEIERNQQSKGLWVKALSDSEGDLDKGQALYVKLRVQMIKDEWAHLDKVLAEKAKAKAEAKAEAKRKKQNKKAKFAFRATLFFVVLFGVCVYRVSFLNDDSYATFAILAISMLGAPLMFLKYLYHRREIA